MSAISDTFWAGRRVLVTGHSGFKGRWLSLWLRSLGAEVTGLSRRRSEDPEVRSIQGTVVDHAAVLAAVEAARPEVVFHLAGFSTVQVGLEDPVLTYSVNAIGTANVLEAIRQTGSHARRRQRDHRQGLPRPGRRAGATARTTASAARTPTRPRRSARSS